MTQFLAILAATFGDPHFRTFDGYQYTFNGYGEYHLMNVVHGDDTFKLQGRMYPLLDDSGEQ